MNNKQKNIQVKKIKFVIYGIRTALILRND